MIRWTRLAALVGLMLAVSPVLFVTSVWADTFRLRQIPLEATVLDETTGEAVSIEAELLVVVRCGAQPSVNAVVVRQRAAGASGRGYVFLGADHAALADGCLDAVLTPILTFQLFSVRPRRTDACARPACVTPVDVEIDLSFDAQGVLTSVESHGADAPSPTAVLATQIALSFLGTPFRFGGSTPETGFDSPGLTQYAYGQAGVAIPRLADAQFLIGAAVDRDALLPGDLVFFQDSSGFIYHVGMSLGGDKFIHAPSTGDVVKISSLNEPFYAGQFVGARRIA